MDCSSDEMNQKLDRRQEIIAEIKELDKEKTQLEQEVKVFMESHDIAKNKRYLVNWKMVVSDRLNTKLLKTEMPEVYGKYLQSSQSSRFTVKELCG